MTPKQKYRGNAINDFESYLECRKNIAAGFYPKHFGTLKQYYRQAFLHNPFRKGFKS